MPAKKPYRFLSAMALACLALFCAHAAIRAEDGAAAATSGLLAYVARQDPSVGWRELASGRIDDAEYAEYVLTSQTWRGIEWKHQLFVLRPANMKPDERHALLFIHGGRWKP